MSMCESILTIALVCTVKYLHYCDYYYTLGNDSQSTPKLIAYKICGFIVDKRNLFFLLFGLLIIFSVISRNWVGVENSMAHYLPGTTETRQGLDLMEEEFITYGTCSVMVANVSYVSA